MVQRGAARAARRAVLWRGGGSGPARLRRASSGASCGAYQHGEEADAEEGGVLGRAERQKEGLVDDIAEDLAADQSEHDEHRGALHRAEQSEQQAAGEADADDGGAAVERRRKDVEQEERERAA